jgi:hypothetical protein
MMMTHDDVVWWTRMSSYRETSPWSSTDVSEMATTTLLVVADFCCEAWQRTENENVFVVYDDGDVGVDAVVGEEKERSGLT